jgi:hypothetical protein
MNVGIYGGGFKPFTTGHYSKLLYACGRDGICKENDVVFLFYGIASRQKGSEYDYTREMATEIFEIYRVAIERALAESGKKVHVVEAKPSPIAMTFAAASEFSGVKRLPLFSFTDWGIDPASINTLTIYGERDSLEDFTRHIDTPKEAAYFGDAAKTGRLQFDPGYEEGLGDERVVQQFMMQHPELSPEEAADRVRIRGSNVRAAIMSKDPDSISRFLPAVLNDVERSQVIDILLRGVPTSENLLRLLVRGFLVS